MMYELKFTKLANEGLARLAKREPKVLIRHCVLLKNCVSTPSQERDILSR